MKTKVWSYFQGDKAIWAFILLLAIGSFLPVFSASTNLVHVIGKGSSFGLLIKHFVHISIGLIIIFLVHRVSIESIKNLSIFAILPVSALLFFTAFQGMMIGGADASRWLKVPLLNITFQPSSIGWIALIAYLSWYLSTHGVKKYSFKTSVLWIWIPVALVVLPVFPSNLSTAAIIFMMACMVLIVGKYPMKYLAKVLGAGAVLLVVFFFMVKAFPDMMPTRFTTWTARIERWGTKDKSVDTYQIDNAKIAIAKGRLTGVGPGKSVQKNFLPQSSSDFIFAIICEEYGLFGGIAVLALYLLLLYRFTVLGVNAPSRFGKYLVIGLGYSIVFQALVNMGVAVEVFPTTGQPLPLISSGGTSIWMTCLSLGIILNISRDKQERQRLEKNKRENMQKFSQLMAEDEKRQNSLQNL